MSLLSVDIGGTKIKVIKYNIRFGVEQENKYETKVFFNQKSIEGFNNLLQIIQLDFGEKFEHVGISLNCPVKLNHVNYSSLMGGTVNIDLKSTVSKYIKFNKFTCNNDVICMAKAELKFGKAKIYQSYLYVNLGTGIRVVFSSDGKVISGFNNLAGEISQQNIWLKEKNNYEIVDNVISGKGINKLSRLLLNKNVNAEEIFHNNYAMVSNAFNSYLADFITSCCYYYNPEAIFFGGSLTKSASNWLKDFRQLYYQKCHQLFITRKIFISKINNPASIGALIE